MYNTKITCDVTILSNLTSNVYRINEISGIHLIQLIAPVDTIKIGDTVSITGFILDKSIEVNSYNSIQLKIRPSNMQQEMLQKGEVASAPIGWYIAVVGLYLLKNGKISNAGIPRKDNYSIGYWPTWQDAVDFYKDWAKQFIN